MTLRSDAVRLTQILDEILVGLARYNRDERSSYTMKMASKLAPMVDSFKDAIFTVRSREDAASSLEDMAELLHEINGAATKGEINFVADGVLDEYWNLSTIFRELKYRGESL